MLTRSTLNGRTARTLRDATRDPYDWMTGPTRRPVPDIERGLGVLLATAIGVLLAIALVRWWAA